MKFLLVGIFLAWLAHYYFKSFGRRSSLYVARRWGDIRIIGYRKDKKRDPKLGPFCTAKKEDYVSGEKPDEYIIENADPEELGLVGMTIFFKRPDGRYHAVVIGKKVPHQTRDQDHLEFSRFDFYAVIPEALASNRATEKERQKLRSALVPS